LCPPTGKNTAKREKTRACSSARVPSTSSKTWTRVSLKQNWIKNERKFGKQAVFLDGRYRDSKFDHSVPNTWLPDMHELVSKGVNIIAPPVWLLMALIGNKEIVPSTSAIHARAAGLDIITWTLERSGLLKTGGGWYYQTVNDVINNDGDAYVALDVLAQDVGILGIFSDWPATVTYYANCKGLK